MRTNDMIIFLSAYLYWNTSVYGEEKPRVDLGVIEERYAPTSIRLNDYEYRIGVRPIFYFNGDRWESYQYVFEPARFKSPRKESEEFAKRREWYFKSNGRVAMVTTESQALLPDSLWLAVQGIVTGLDSVPDQERKSDFGAEANSKPVRPPIVVATVQGFAVSEDILGPVKVNAEDIPKHVLEAGYAGVVEQINRGLSSQDIENISPDVEELVRKTLLKQANRYTIEREGVNIYSFIKLQEPEWTTWESPWVVENSRVEHKAWPLREELKFLVGGDFNGDGNWEYLFWIDSYNEDGYLLASDGLRRSVSYSWHYH